jgi:short-subunit dehydrogenase
MDSGHESRHSPLNADGRWALVTGPTAGIGLELAKLAAADGYNLALVARNGEQLEKVGAALRDSFGARCELYAQDLSEHGGSENVIRFLRRKKILVDLAINNAGVGFAGRFAELDITEQLNMMRLNLMAVTHLTHYAMGVMLSRGSGAILNVASTAAFQPGPLMAVYYASKAYVLSFTQAVAEEMRGSGVKMSVVCPGPTRTGFQQKAGLHKSSLIYRLSFMSADAVARRGYRGLWRGQTVIVPGVTNKLFAILVRMLPHALAARVVHTLHTRRNT